MRTLALAACLLAACFCQVFCDETPPLIGRDDGHENHHHGDDEPLIGRDDGHENHHHGDDEPLIGRDDGHENHHHGDEQETGDETETDDDESDDYEEKDDHDVHAAGEDEYSYDADDDYDGDEPLVRCKRPECLIYCEHGERKDSRGCPTCDCLPAPSLPVVPAVDPTGNRDDGVVSGGKPDCSRRPMCAMYCANGFKTGSDGCPICSCNSGSGGGLIGRPDGHELKPNQPAMCKDKPICRMYCQLGFQTGDDGCDVCACLEDPCRTSTACPAGTVCQAQPCQDIRSCTQLVSKCVPMPCSGPEPMCANYCPNGYKKNAANCMTCDCAEDSSREMLCAGKKCEEGQVCRNSTNGSSRSCSVKTLCEIQSDRITSPLTSSSAPQCLPDGSFKPLQCNPRQGECWCVDGLGQEMAETRRSVWIEEQKPNCVRNNTISMHVHMTLIIEHDVIIMDNLNSTIVDHVSSWLLIEPHYIKVTKAAELTGDYSSSSEDEDRSRLIVVEFVVFHDGHSDLPSAANYMKQKMHNGMCHIPMGSGSLRPNPYSMTMQHHFEHEYHGHHGMDGPSDIVCVWRRYGHLLGFLLISILALSTILCAFICLRRRARRQQFRRKRLSNASFLTQTSVPEEKEKLQSAPPIYTEKASLGSEVRA